VAAAAAGAQPAAGLNDHMADFTSSLASKDMLLEILETSLALNHASIVKRYGRYDITPKTEALKSAPSILCGSLAPTTSDNVTVCTAAMHPHSGRSVPPNCLGGAHVGR